ncbi:MAG: sulfurase [Flavobacteriaceae bacterium]|nr:MAG: sulfurase [Flavobacteriaceae bacterium]
MKVISTNIGKKTTLLWKGKEVQTGILKKATNTPITLGIEDVQGDAVIDRRYHGGVDQAVYAYGEQHYAYWQNLYPSIEMKPGFFGENLTISNLDENTIYVGAIYELGTAIVQVTKPRQPCMKLGIIFGTQQVLKQFWSVPKCGFYFKILKEGTVEKGAQLTLIESSKNSKSIAEVYTEKRKKKAIE